MTPEQLKNSILQYAIQGKLVEQRKEEGTAEELYKKIQEEKQHLIKEGKIKKQKALPEITEDEIPFDIPKSWKWVRLGEIVTVFGGKRIPAGRSLTSVDTGYKYIRVSDMKNGTVKTDNIMYIPYDVYPLISKYTINKEDIYITVAGTIGDVGIIPDNLDGSNLTENANKLVFKLINKHWLVNCLKSQVIQLQIIGATTKVGQPKLAIKRIQSFLIPLPPLDEQKRIVSKIEELLPLVDDYAKTYEELEKLNAKFPEDMKKSILQYAIQGKLVEQKKEEGTAEELYKKIQEEKQKLITEGKIKKQKELPEIIEDEIPFDIPESWKLVRLGDLGDYKKGPFGSALTKNLFVQKSKDTVKVYEQKNAIKKDCNIGDYYITKDYFENKMLSFEVLSGDIIVSCAGTIGETYVLPNNIEQGIINQALMRIRIFNNINIDYFLVYFETILKKSAQTHGKGSAIKNIPPFDVLKKYTVALPPLEEQKRIVDKIDELLPLFEKLNIK